MHFALHHYHLVAKERTSSCCKGKNVGSDVSIPAEKALPLPREQNAMASISLCPQQAKGIPDFLPHLITTKEKRLGFLAKTM
jgi:hypothetical protein